ncbi:MAG: alpha/beta fold hydrolase [Firmicutes bacterium]|nr:alpha/beta fold hydrolase [Bacillota bacterium]
MADGKASFFLSGSRTGCLLLHGFTSTPAELRPLGEALHRAGYTVHAPLLPGHGTSPEDLLHITYCDWIEGAQQGLNRLKQGCSSVVVIGHSMGGLLALQMAARNRVSALVTIAAALKVANPLVGWAWLLKYFQPYVEAERRSHPPAVQQYLLHYSRFPTAAVAELHNLAAHTKTILPHITAPALIVQTRDDRTVKPESAQIIYAKIASRRKECCWLEEGTHNLPAIAPHNQALFHKILEFIAGENLHRAWDWASPEN